MSLEEDYFKRFMGGAWDEVRQSFYGRTAGRYQREYDLSDAELVAIRAYTMADQRINYRQLNAALRKHPQMPSPELCAYGHVLRRALRKLPPYLSSTPGNVAVHRRTQLDPPVRASYVVGSRIPLLGFTSTTRKPPSKFCGDDAMLIASRKGRDISDLSAFPEEFEVIFDHLTYVDVLEIESLRNGGLFLSLREA